MFILDNRRLAADHSYSLTMKLGKGQKRCSDQVTHNFQTLFELKPEFRRGGWGELGKIPVLTT